MWGWDDSSGEVDVQSSQSTSKTIAERSKAADAADMLAQIRDRLASEDDAVANARDRAAESRDDEAEHLEQLVYDDAVRRGISIARQRGPRHRQAAGGDRAGSHRDRDRDRHDREAAHKDRDRASDDRDAATAALAGHDKEYARLEDHADDMLVVGQAQGILMQARGLTAAEALLEIFTRASDDRTGLRVAAQDIVNDVTDDG